ncbi:hypothetical protein WN943_019224 [Citrus x changshan-huyou]
MFSSSKSNSGISGKEWISSASTNATKYHNSSFFNMSHGSLPAIWSPTSNKHMDHLSTKGVQGLTKIPTIIERWRWQLKYKVNNIGIAKFGYGSIEASIRNT